MSARRPFGRGTHQRKLAPGTDLIAYFKALDAETRRGALDLLNEAERQAIDRAWEHWAHAGQLAPCATADGADWATWVIMAGRGFGKTLAGAQWVTARIAEESASDLRIALVAATLDDARAIMIEGRSGLLAVAAPWIADWQPTLRRLRFRNGAEAHLFSGSCPRLLRGPEHHYAWCDELAKWDRGEETWDMLQMGLRLGDSPQAVVTTTPRPGPVLRAIMAAPGTVVTGGPTRANPHLSATWRARIEATYAGTRLGRQELDGELLPDAAGALWTVELIERCRIPSRNGQLEPSSARDARGPQGGDGARVDKNPAHAEPVEALSFSPTSEEQGSPSTSSGWTGEGMRGGFARTLIAVDPPSGDGTCGIIACAREGPSASGGQSAIAHVLADHSVTARSPEGWARAVAAAAAAHGTTEVIAEANQGGKMVKAVLHTADPKLRVKLVHASVGKTTRAEPVAHLFEAGRVRLHGRMGELEAELLGMIAGGGYEGPGRSPDRADAMVWGVGEVRLGEAQRQCIA